MRTFEALLQTFAGWRAAEARAEDAADAGHLDILLGALRGQPENPILFDSAWYLARNELPTPGRGPAKAALTHYLKAGLDQRLDPTSWFNESAYRTAYPDVAQAISAGDWRCGYQHYLLRGLFEARSPGPAFNELAYLGRNPDILAAVRAGHLPCGLIHFFQSGRAESRSLTPAPQSAPLDLPLALPIPQMGRSEVFAAGLYRTTGGDLAGITDPADCVRHWQEHGVSEDLSGRRGRIEGWVENTYLQRNPELASHIGGEGQQPTGYSHFLMYGAAEGRAWAGAEWADREQAHLQDALTRRTPLPPPPDGQAWPLISVIVPVYNPDRDMLRDCIRSVRAQSYPHWQLCLADDASSWPHVSEILVEAARADDRVRVEFALANGGISAASNRALALAEGAFVALLDHDDILAPDALLHLATAFLSAADVDMVYTDEAKLTEAGQCIGLNPKPSWSPELLLSTMYTGHLSAYRRSVMLELGGFRPMFDGTQDYDLALRVSEVARRVVHVPLPLYFWRMSPASTAGSIDAKPGVLRLQARALESALLRRGRPGRVQAGHSPGHWAVVLDPPAALPLVSIVIPTAGRSATMGGREIDLVVNCVQSLHRSEHYGNYEIVLVHNGDLRAETLSQLALYPRLRLVAYDAHPFNLSDKINLGVTAAAGDYVLLLNDDMQAQSAGILQSMLGRMHDGVGLVGGRLLFANGSLQHAGVVWTAEGPTHAMIGEQRLTPGPAQRLQVTHDVFGVSGACLFARRSVFLGCGGFPSDLPLNYNDVALCLNVRASGLRVVFNPDVTMFHFESVSKSGTYFWELQHLVLQHHGLSDPYLNPAFDSGNPFYQLRPHAQAQALSYRGWLLSRIDWRRFKRPSSQAKTFSMILSVYETPLRFLLELEATLLRQTYRNWELALVDNGCRVPEVVAWIDRMRLHPQVTFVRLAENMGIMGGYGAAFRAATGDYVVPVDSDDLLSLDCLDVLAYHLERLDWPDAVYSDEDKTDSRSSIHSPFLKPDWDPVLFMNICYVCHICAIDRLKALAIGAYTDDAASGCHDWDSFLRLLRAGARIAHVPEILYTWRIHAGSTASIETGNKPYTLTSQRHVLEQHVRLTGLSGAFEVAENTLFPHDGIWRLRPTGRRLPPLTLLVLAAADPVRTAQFLGDLALARRPDCLKIVVVGRQAAAFDPGMSLIDEVRRALWPEGPIEHAASLADAVSADTHTEPARVVAVVSAEISALPPDWLHEGLGMFGFAEDVGAVGGTVVTEDGMTVWRGGFAGFGSGASSPDFGGRVTESGYHGMGWCQRSVDAVPAVCFMARATLLGRALARLGPAEYSLRMVTGSLAIEARAGGLRTIHTPFMRATLARLVEVGPLLPPGAAFAPKTEASYYPSGFGQTIDAAYRLATPHA